MKKRACDLQKGEVFRLYNHDCVVAGRANGRLNYRQVGQNHVFYLGAKSQQWVEMVNILPEPETIKQIKRHEAIYDNIRSLYSYQ